MLPNVQQPSFNAVKIDIIEPKNQFGSNPNCQSPLNPLPPEMYYYNYPNAPMYNYTPNGLYNIPAGNIYGAQNPQQMTQTAQTGMQQNPNIPQVNPPQINPNYINQAASQQPTQIYQYPLPIPVTMPPYQMAPGQQYPVAPAQGQQSYPAPMPPVATSAPPAPVSIPPVEHIPQPVTPQTASVQPAPANETPASAPTPVSTPVPTPAPASTPAPTSPQAPAPTPETPAAPANEAEKIQKDFEESKNNMKSDNADTRLAGIMGLAQLAQQNPQLAPGLLDPEVFKILVGDETQKGIITKQIPVKPEDVKQGETQEQATARQNEEAAAIQKEEASKMIGMFTLALLLKNIRTELKKDANQPQTLALSDLPGIAQIITNLKQDPSKKVRSSALQAIKYVQEPEDRNIAETLFKIALQQDVSPEVKVSAMDGLLTIATPDKIKEYEKWFKDESKAAEKAGKKEQDEQTRNELTDFVKALDEGIQTLQDPNKLSRYQNPQQAEQQAQTGQPAQSVQPVQPVQPTQPSQPGQPNQQTQPAQAGQ